MNYLSVENLSKSFPHRVLFNNITFGIEKGEKVAIVAQNGAGKSTLLSILCGKEKQDTGAVAFRNGISVGILEQDPDLDDKMTVLEAVFAGSSEIMLAIKEYDEALLNTENENRFNNALAKMEQLQAWDYEARLKQMLSILNIENFDQRVSELSGGQKKRVALARVLVEQPDLLILDEPTNHLDLELITWIEDYLTKSTMTLLMVTHDRYFLDRICNIILELDQGNIYRYTGSYRDYLEKKAERQQIEAVTVHKAKNLMKKELDWIRKQPRARGTKAKYRVEAFDKIKETAEKNTDVAEVKIGMGSSRMGKKILEFHKVTKSYGDICVVKDFEYLFRRGEKIGIVGKNGVGKSSFLNLLTGLEQVDSGSIETGETIVLGYYKQDNEDLNPDKRVIEIIKDIAEFISLGDGTQISAGNMLERFLFSPEQQYAPVNRLSGGEKRRLYLLTILMKNPNFLVLDEPTNDLDIMTLAVLEDFLENFPGCLVTVSHDRYFMDKLSDHLFIFEGNGVIRDFNGRYTDFEVEQALLKEKGSQPKKESPTPVDNTPPKAEKTASSLTYKEKRELDLLEESIAKAETTKTELETLISNTTEHEKLIELSSRYEKLKNELEEQTFRWLELSEKNG